MYIPSIINCTNVPTELGMEINSNKEIDTVHLYVDLKNASTGLFVPDIVSEMVEYSKQNKTNSSAIFQANILIASNWIYWCKKRNLNCKIFFITDSGKSQYHMNLNKNYKSTRKISNTTLANLKEDLNVIQEKNYEISETFFKEIKNIYFCHLKFLESDFVPYWLITRNYKDKKNIFHVIGSNDKDHFQTLCIPNTAMFYKKGLDHYYYTRTNFFNRYVKLEKMSQTDQLKITNIIVETDPAYISFIMSLVGDSSDNVPGTMGFGEKTAIKLFSNKLMVNSLLGSPEDIQNRVSENKNCVIDDALPLSQIPDVWKKLIHSNDQITNSYKQINYECLCKWLERRDTTYKLDTIQKFEDIEKKENVKVGKEFYNEFRNKMMSVKDYSLDDGTGYPMFV